MSRYLCALTLAAGILGAMADSAAAQGPEGRWLAERIGGSRVSDSVQTVLEIAPGGVVSGRGGCNRMAGQATISGDRITFGRIASTRMACAAPVMDQEGRFFAALSDVQTWRIEPGTKNLILFDADGQPLVVLTRM
jgi:heat shock protein HslJ